MRWIAENISSGASARVASSIFVYSLDRLCSLRVLQNDAKSAAKDGTTLAVQWHCRRV
ncbi:hypothetical protein L218DRAFT_1035251 [Marasmius fiardii PR-910]|nr:hypothetical protein L218DRAFT_1035251 [Marasmius fiardii PR-910]